MYICTYSSIKPEPNTKHLKIVDLIKEYCHKFIEKENKTNLKSGLKSV